MDSAAEFPKETRKRFGERRSRGRYPRQLRELALAHLEFVLRRGGRVPDAAKDLSLDPNTLRNWRKDAAKAQRKEGRLQRVAVVSDENAPKYIVHGPADTRIECIDAKSVADLLRALR